MTARIPLVLNSGAFQELQAGDSFNLGTGASLTSPTIATSATFSYGTANQVQFLNASKQLVGSAGFTFDGTTLSAAGFSGPLTGNVTGNVSGNAGTVTNGVYTVGDQTIGGTKTFSSNPVLNGGSVNGVAYLNGSKVLTTGSALTFDGTNITNTQNTASPIGLKINNSSASTSAGTIVSFQYGGSDVGYIGNQFDGGNFNTKYMSASAHIWLQSSSEQMRLTSTGLGIGTSSPGYSLDIAKNQSGGRGATIQLYNAFGQNASTRLQFNQAGATAFVDGTCQGGNENGGAYLSFGTSSSTSAATEKMVLNQSGNLGLGVTPSAWRTSFSTRAIQVGPVGSLSSLQASTTNNQTYLTSNAFLGTSDWIYQFSDAATQYRQFAGGHQWFTAPSGTAGNAISFTQAMTLDASGRLAIGATSAGMKLEVLGGSSAGAVNVAHFYQSDLTANSSAALYLNSSNGNTARSTVIRAITNGAATGNGHSLAFETSANGTAPTERMRIDSSGNMLIGTTSTSINGKLTNAGEMAALASTGNFRSWTQIYTAAASNNATVDIWLGRDTAGNVIGTNTLVGHFYINITGASGANSASAVYAVSTNGNGTTAGQYSFTLVSNSSRGTSPITSIAIVNDGGVGAIKLQATYIDNASVVTGGSSKVVFVGLIG